MRDVHALRSFGLTRPLFVSVVLTVGEMRDVNALRSFGLTRPLFVSVVLKSRRDA